MNLIKGIDLIADCFPTILEKHANVQLICIGPVIDMYGKFAAAKLDAMMKKYPRRVCSKPVFTALPPFIFTGAEFALIPSRDEPFGLVAVEFGRKGALGVGARVGGLGQMPGRSFPVDVLLMANASRLVVHCRIDHNQTSPEAIQIGNPRSACVQDRRPSYDESEIGKAAFPSRTMG